MKESPFRAKMLTFRRRHCRILLPTPLARRSSPSAKSTASPSPILWAHGPLSQDVRKEICRRHRAICNYDAFSDPFFEQLLDEHYERLPVRYSIDLQVDKAEDVLLHRRIKAAFFGFHTQFLLMKSSKLYGAQQHLIKHSSRYL